jgi:hypothetical protein
MGIQDFAVFGIVAVAAGYLGRTWFFTAKGTGGCGKCSSCPSSSAPKNQEPQLVQIDLGGSWKRN